MVSMITSFTHSVPSCTLPGLPHHTLTELLGILHVHFILEVPTCATPRRKEEQEVGVQTVQMLPGGQSCLPGGGSERRSHPSPEQRISCDTHRFGSLGSKGTVSEKQAWSW